jgi:2-desacetyl-2-hydroxyethyl bacteriochlorophyllide A dehydrogenase
MVTAMNRKSVVFKKPYKLELRKEPIPELKTKEVLIQSQYSAISSGTEMLVYRGLFPPNLPVDGTIEVLSKPFGYPLKYGYTIAGQVVAIGTAVKKDWLGQRVFCFHPHESHFVTKVEDLIPIPADIDSTEALFLSGMETAVNFLMDGRPVIGERVVIFGQGVVGLLTTALLALFPLSSLVTLDGFALRRNKSLEVGAHGALDPHKSDAWQELADRLGSYLEEATADLVFELSGNPMALNQAIAVAGYGSRIVIGSWYGKKAVKLELGSKFHRGRIRLISSQVSTLAPEFSARWTKFRRLNIAWDMIRKIKPGRFISHRFAVDRAKEAFELLDKNPENALQVILEYCDNLKKESSDVHRSGSKRLHRPALPHRLPRESRK